MLGVSVTGRDAVWSQQQIPIGKVQLQPLSFWSKAKLSYASNYFPLRNNSCYGGLDHRRLGDHVT